MRQGTQKVGRQSLLPSAIEGPGIIPDLNAIVRNRRIIVWR
ncbi:MAG: hypothetical protein O2930_00125 [Acidobacteria bacterium]|nr:hypothetical protein [Acidobacteriota bacterium]